MKAKLINYILALFGVSSCYTVCMYGTPMAVFETEVEVTDMDGKPIQGIRVVQEPMYKDNEGNWKTEAGGYDNDTTFTDASGKAMLSTRAFSFGNDYTRLNVYFDDVDGEANGGEFESAQISNLESPDVIKKGEGTWNRGTYGAEVKMKLKKKK